MVGPNLNFILISLIFCSPAFAIDGRPKWVTDTALSDSSYYYVVCSHDGLDPEDVKQVAENRCLASAAKLGEVEVKVSQKTVQSLTGADSAEVAEISPLNRTLSCEWLDRFVEKIENGFRVWLRCRISKKTVKEFNRSDLKGSINKDDAKVSSKPAKYKRAILNLAMVPNADRVIILNENGERAVVEVKSNVESIELKDNDLSVIVKKQKYHDEKINLGKWENGDSLSRTVYLKPEL